MPGKIFIGSIILRTVIFVIAWYVFTHVSTWIILYIQDVAAPIWYKAINFLLYPLAGLWFVIDVILTFRKTLPHKVWIILGLYFVAQILCSPFTTTSLIALDRKLTQHYYRDIMEEL
ncbi:MAG: hypothetical protein ACN2B6_08245 [Rickettsiales bacterium]